MSTILKTLVGGLAAVAVTFAFAQGNPPTPAAANPAQGAGQRSTQDTPMGATGTPVGGAAVQGSTGSAAPAAAPGADTSAAPSMPSDNMAGTTPTTTNRKVAKADRG